MGADSEAQGAEAGLPGFDPVPAACIQVTWSNSPWHVVQTYKEGLHLTEREMLPRKLSLRRGV